MRSRHRWLAPRRDASNGVSHEWPSSRYRCTPAPPGRLLIGRLLKGEPQRHAVAATGRGRSAPRGLHRSAYSNSPGSKSMGMRQSFGVTPLSRQSQRWKNDSERSQRLIAARSSRERG